MEKSYGLVLEGGGAKGSYQIGAYLALSEMGFNFDAVAGTSIGAINGAFIASGEINKCIYMWENLSLHNFFAEDSHYKLPNLSDDLDMISKIKEYRKLMSQGTIPSAPLKHLIYDSLSEEKIRNSKMRYGLATVNVTDRKFEMLFAEEIKEGELLDYIIGSAYTPFFKVEPLHGKYFLDGGFFNNIPFEMVENLGMRAVIIRANPKDRHDNSFPKDSIVIEPKKELNSVLNFDTERAKYLMKLGYYDAFKAVKELPGRDYYFESFDEAKALDIFVKNLFPYFKESPEKYKYKSPYRILFEECFPKIANNLELENNYRLADLLAAIIEEKFKKEDKERFNFYRIDDYSNDLKFEDFFIKGDNRNLIQRLINN